MTRRTRIRYLVALSRRFRVTVGLALAFFGLMPLVFTALYRGPHGGRIRYGEALHHVYFLMFGQPSLPYVANPLLEALNFAIPPLGVAVIVDGVVRFAYLFFAKHHKDKEWFEVISESMSGHVIVCGAGRIGYRVAQQLLELKREVVVIEKREECHFVSVLRDADVAVMIDDVKNPMTLTRANVARASAIVCATDDDLANLNAALDARRVNPTIRVVLRLFDDDLGARVREAFHCEVLSSSALAAPALALSALDPRIVHSFHVAGELMVVSRFVARAGLAGLTVAAVSERYSALVLSRTHAGSTMLHPAAADVIEAGDALTLQATYGDYQKLREATGEREPPRSPEA